MKVSEPTISREDQLSFVKVEKLRRRDPDDIRRALLMVCGDKTLDQCSISNVVASVEALDSEDQISYVKVETLRNISPIMDVHRAVQTVCGRKTFSSSTYTRWSNSFKKGKSVRLGYQKPLPDLHNVHLLKKIINQEVDRSSSENEESSEIAATSDGEATAD